MAESGDRKDPFRAFNFLVEIDGVTTETGFSEVSGLSMETDAVEYRNGDEKENHVRKLTGLNKYGNITMKRGFTKDAKSLWDWRKKVMDGKTERASGTITLLNEAREMSESEDGLMVQVGVGIGNVIEKCPDYRNVQAPTAIPPTLIPPTPIGGL